MLWDIGDPFKDIIIILVIEDPSYISVLSQVSKSVYERIHNEEFWALLCKFHFGLTPTYSHESNLMNPNYHFYREILAGPYRPCALCRKYPITGVRYKCLNCVDVDLCEECENSGIHPLNHLVYKTFYPELKPKQIRARGKIPLPECSVCMEKPTRYMFHKCISLNENYFFCESCSSDKESTHALGSNSSRLWKIKCGVALNSIVSSERRGKNPRGAWCDIRYPGMLVLIFCFYFFFSLLMLFFVLATNSF